MLKRLIKNNEHLYRSWFILYRKPSGAKVNLPSSSDQVFITGYPRSGNSFMKYIVQTVLPNLHFESSHLHTIGAIKIALRAGVPTKVLTRKPIDAISSYAIMQSYYGKGDLKQIKFIDNLVSEYLDYYEYVYQNRSKLAIIPFEQVVNTRPILSSFNKEFDLGLSEEELTSRLELAKEQFAERQGSKPKERTSMPNAERTRMKKEVKRLINEKSQKIKTANLVYEKITKTL